MQNIRVMHVIYTLANAGLENVVLNLCRKIQRPRVEQLVCCLEEHGPIAESLEKLGIPVFFMGKKPGIGYLLPFRLARLFRQQKIDIVHSHDADANIYGSLAGLIARVKHLVKTEHGSIQFTSSTVLKADVWLSKYMDRIITVSVYLKKQSIQLGVPSEKIEVIFNGVKIENLPEPVDNEEKRKELGFAVGEKIIFTVGRFIPLKNTELLIKVAPRIVAEFPKTKFAIIGYGPLQAKLEKMVVDLKLQDNVKFLINRMDVPQLLPCMDIFVLCSRFEGLGLVILEAMSAKKPVVATETGGIPDIIKHNKNGLLFPSDNEEELIAALRKLLMQPELGEKLAEEGYKTLKSQFDIEEMVRNYEKTYLDLCGS